jgi:hypothetical protein
VFRSPRAGDRVTAPIGAPHTFFNPDPHQPATMLFIFTPARFVNYFREMGSLAMDEAAYPHARLEVMSRYATELSPPLPDSRSI